MKMYRLAALCLMALSSVTALSAQNTSSPYYHKFWNLQKNNWGPGYALLSPSWSICSSCSSTSSRFNWYRNRYVSSPSMSGSAARQHIGGTRAYSDLLWNDHLVGSFSTQGLPDYSNTLTKGARNFIYDVYFYASNIGYSQALEFDINQFLGSAGGKGYIWGHECRIAGGHEWDTYDNVHKKWVATGVPCNPKNNAWNHLVIQVARTSGGNLLFKSITLNGVTHTLNIYRAPGTTGWNGITINYQQDGDSSMHAYSIYLDKVNFT
ncbi:MAG TPA: hypothetical protein VFM77_16390, partial [Terriglobales bacterium]|nr:hypothetical protein [Terriglobales bacterium]